MVDRTMPALLRSLRNRVTSLERRISRGTYQLPDRLSPTGAEVTDWNDATSVGFYWSENTAANAPFADRFLGQVFVMGGDGPIAGRLVQELQIPTTGVQGRMVWRRYFSGGAWTAWAPDAWAGLPVPIKDFGNDSFSFTFPAASWGIIAGSSDISFGVLPAKLEVELRVSGMLGTTTAAAYAMLGASCRGGLNLDPEIDQDGLGSFRATPYSNIPDAGGSQYNNPVYGTKRVVVPAGSPTTVFRLWARRNTANGTQRVQYSQLEAVPIRWVP